MTVRVYAANNPLTFQSKTRTERTGTMVVWKPIASTSAPDANEFISNSESTISRGVINVYTLSSVFEIEI